MTGAGSRVGPPRSPLVLRLALAVGSLVLTLLTAEVVFRVAGIRATYHRPRSDMVIPSPTGPTEPAPYAFIPFATVRSTYDSDPRGYFDPGHVIDHVHNSLGWRDAEHTLDKREGVYRILGLGDSYLWGQGVRQEDICLTRLGRLLEQSADGVSVETINTGLSGSNTAFHAELLHDVGLAFRPDLVVLHFVPNDVEPFLGGARPQIEFFTNYTSIYLGEDRLSRISRLWGWARQRFLQEVRARRYVRECIASFSPSSSEWAGCRDAIDDLNDICRDHDIPLLVVVFPFFHELDGDYPFQPVHDVVRGHCRTRGIPVVDLRPYFSQYHGPELWVHPSDQHPNEIAHRVAARAAVDAILAQHERFRFPVRWQDAGPSDPSRRY